VYKAIHTRGRYFTYRVVIVSSVVEVAGTQPDGKFKNSQVVTVLEVDEVCLSPRSRVSY